MAGKTLGIDLGTTNSCMAVAEGILPTVIPNREGGRTTPSIVAFKADGSSAVGLPAKRQAILNPSDTIFSVKRLMGRKYDDPDIKSLMHLLPYTLGKDTNNGDARVRIKERLLSPPEISAMVLRKLKDDAEAYLGSEVDKAIVTVPAYFNDSQRQATKDAGTIAGLDVIRIINEPTAAALASGLGGKQDMRIAVYDLGGGTFDVSILEIARGIFEVKATSGNTYLGGDDFDARIVAFLMDEFKKRESIDLRENAKAMQRLKEAAETAKIELSSAVEVAIALPFIFEDKSMELSLTRTQFENMVKDLVEKTEIPCKKALESAKMNAKDIDAVVLVGGMTRMPRVVEKVKEIFQRQPYARVNPDEVVASGAALQGSIMGGDIAEVLLLDVTPLSLGVRTVGDGFKVIIEKNTTIPIRKSEIFTTAENNQTFVNIAIFQGEEEKASLNHPLGEFQLIGIKPMDAGKPRVDVSFEINADGILNVTAKDKDTGQVQSIVIKPSTGLDREQVKRMSKEVQVPPAFKAAVHGEMGLAPDEPPKKIESFDLIPEEAPAPAPAKAAEPEEEAPPPPPPPPPDYGSSGSSSSSLPPLV
jgi:molecular chaperone DnaK